VSDQETPPSGSRWEPATGGLTSPADDAAVPAEHAAVPADDVRPTRPRRRIAVAVAAAGVGLVLAGGVGGFAIGHAVAGNTASVGAVTDQNGVPGDGPDGGGDGGTA
jgi:hypothetical protein